MRKELFDIQLLFRLLRHFVVVYLGAYAALFFYSDWDWGNFLSNGFKIVCISIATMIYCYGAIAIIRDIKAGALAVLVGRIKTWFKVLIHGR